MFPSRGLSRFLSGFTIVLESRSISSILIYMERQHTDTKPRRTTTGQLAALRKLSAAGGTIIGNWAHLRIMDNLVKLGLIRRAGASGAEYWTMHITDAGRAALAK